MVNPFEATLLGVAMVLWLGNLMIAFITGSIFNLCVAIFLALVIGFAMSEVIKRRAG